MIEGLHGYNTFDISQAHADADPTRFRLADHRMPRTARTSRQLFIRLSSRCPTGRKALFVNEFNTSHIVEYGTDSEEGEELLQSVFRVLYDEKNTYTHHYDQHDLVMWNNFSTQHARTARIDQNPRTFRRLVLTSLNW